MDVNRTTSIHVCTWCLDVCVLDLVMLCASWINNIYIYEVLIHVEQLTHKTVSLWTYTKSCVSFQWPKTTHTHTHTLCSCVRPCPLACNDPADQLPHHNTGAFRRCTNTRCSLFVYGVFLRNTVYVYDVYCHVYTHTHTHALHLYTPLTTQVYSVTRPLISWPAQHFSVYFN